MFSSKKRASTWAPCSNTRGSPAPTSSYQALTLRSLTYWPMAFLSSSLPLTRMLRRTPVLCSPHIRQCPLACTDRRAPELRRRSDPLSRQRATQRESLDLRLGRCFGCGRVQRSSHERCAALTDLLLPPHVENSSVSACAMTSSGEGGASSVVAIASASGSPLARQHRTASLTS